jgi:hypothetical protein
MKGEKRMKNKCFLLLSIVALLGFVATIGSVEVWAQQEENRQEGPIAPGWKDRIAVEFSTDTTTGLSKDVDQAGVPNSLQNLHTQPPYNGGAANPKNTFDFGTSGQVDALANGGDHLFWQLLDTTNTKVNLLVSFQGDQGANAVWYETRAGNRGVQWTHLELDAALGNGDVLTAFQGLDALEVWGPSESDDANFYSLQGDPGGISVFSWTPPAGPSAVYIPQPVIQAACVSLGYNNEVTVDLDGLMVFERRGIDGNKIWDSTDAIIFSIRNTKPAGNWDGGEIVVLQKRLAALDTVYFLYNGGHRWDTNFNVSGAFGAPVTTEEVDAIEAYYSPPYQQTPTLTGWGMIVLAALIVASAVYIMLRKRRVTVAA